MAAVKIKIAINFLANLPKLKKLKLLNFGITKLLKSKKAAKLWYTSVIKICYKDENFE